VYVYVYMCMYMYTSLTPQVLDEESMKVVRMIESNPVGFRSLLCWFQVSFDHPP
jgi:hypothetical protein